MEEIHKKSYFGWGGDSHPSQEPQELQLEEDRRRMLRMPETRIEKYVWVVSGRHMAVVDEDSIEEAFVSLGIKKEHHGPFAFGKVEVSNRWKADFLVEQSNIDLESLNRIFLRWSKDPMINFDDVNHPIQVSMVKDKNGFPLPVKAPKEAADPGVGDGNYPDKLWVNTDDGDLLAQDIQRDYPGQGDMQSDGGGKLTDEVYQCGECFEKFESYEDFKKHVSEEHLKGPETGPEYEIRDNDEFFYPDNEVSRPGGWPGIHTGAVEGPTPFSYDIISERIILGQIGDDISTDQNIMDKVEGYYTPENDLLIVGYPSQPYSISSLVNSWLQFYPEHEIKHVYLIRKENGIKIKEKVANA